MALQPRDGNKGQSSPARGRDRKGQARDAPNPLPAAKPFVCCLKEYGVMSKIGKVGTGEKRETGLAGQAGVDAVGWERRWRLFGTVVM